MRPNALSVGSLLDQHERVESLQVRVACLDGGGRGALEGRVGEAPIAIVLQEPLHRRIADGTDPVEEDEAWGKRTLGGHDGLHAPKVVTQPSRSTPTPRLVSALGRIAGSLIATALTALDLPELERRPAGVA